MDLPANERKAYQRYGRPHFKTVPLHANVKYEHTTHQYVPVHASDEAQHALKQYRRAATLAGLQRKLMHSGDLLNHNREFQHVCNALLHHKKHTDNLTCGINDISTLAQFMTLSAPHRLTLLASCSKEYRARYDNIIRSTSKANRDTWRQSMLDDPHHRRAYKFLKSGQNQPMVALRCPRDWPIDC